MSGRSNHTPSFLFGSAPFGGIVTQIQNLREVLGKRKDIECTWLFVERQPPEIISHIPPFSQNWTLKAGMVMRSRIRALERKGKTFDAALFNHITPLSLLGRFQRRVPIIISIDTTPRLLERYGKWYNTRPANRRSAIETFKHNHVSGIYHRAAYLFAWTGQVRRSLVEDYGVSDKKITVLAPGIDLRKWNGAAEKSNDIHRKVCILFVGGEFRRKGGDLLVKLARQPEFLDCEFHFATQSFEGTPAPNIFIHTNLSPNSDLLISLYRSADIFALPTRGDLFAVSGLEAMSMGLPVVMTDVGATREMVHDGTTGYVIPVDDENALRERLLALVRNEELRRNLGRNGRKMAEELVDGEKNADLIVETLRRVSGT
jgi:glycosyltransferase involved in cell wall biosynthesis